MPCVQMQSQCCSVSVWVIQKSLGAKYSGKESSSSVRPSASVLCKPSTARYGCYQLLCRTPFGRQLLTQRLSRGTQPSPTASAERPERRGPVRRDTNTRRCCTVPHSIKYHGVQVHGVLGISLWESLTLQVRTVGRPQAAGPLGGLQSNCPPRAGPDESSQQRAQGFHQPGLENLPGTAQHLRTTSSPARLPNMEKGGF